MFYRWIVIENSLKDKTIINKYQVLSETKFAAGDPKRESRMLKIRVPEEEVHPLAEVHKPIVNRVRSVCEQMAPQSTASYKSGTNRTYGEIYYISLQ
jgi:hypothetical protein